MIDPLTALALCAFSFVFGLVLMRFAIEARIKALKMRNEVLRNALISAVRRRHNKPGVTKPL